MPAACANSSLAKCGILPMTFESSASFGFALHSAISSLTVLMLLFGLTTRMIGAFWISPIGAKSG